MARFEGANPDQLDDLGMGRQQKQHWSASPALLSEEWG